MAGYTLDEVAAITSTFVRDTPKTVRDPLGPTDLQSRFEETRRLLAASLIAAPESIFYIIYLATNKLNQSVVAAVSWIDDLLQAVQEVGNPTQEVSKTTLLGDASTALLTVDSLLYQNGNLSPVALSRYIRAVERFTASIAPNIKSGNELVRPPQLARKEAASTLSKLVATYPELLATARQISRALEEFTVLQLATVAAKESVRAVRLDVRDLQQTFEGLTDKEEKAAFCREAFLRLVAGKAVLQQYLSTRGPLQEKLSQSSTRLGRAAALDVTPAEVRTTVSAPWAVSVGDTLVLAVDGGEATPITLTPKRAVLIGKEGPFVIPSSEAWLTLDELSPPLQLTPGGRSAEEVAAEIQLWANQLAPGVYTAYVSAGRVAIQKNLAGAQKLTITGGLEVLTVLGFYNGQTDMSEALSTAELVAAITEECDVDVVPFFVLFEEGRNGIVSATNTFLLPLNTIASTEHVGDQLLILGGPNAGYHRITEVTRDAQNDIVHVNEPFTQLVAEQRWRIIREGVAIRSKSADLSTRLVVEEGTANLALGLSAGTVYGTTYGFMASDGGVDVDFSAAAITDNDVLFIGNSAYEIDSCEGTQLRLKQPISTAVQGVRFSISSSAALAYERFIADLTSWFQRLEASAFSVDVGELERVLNPLWANKHPSLAQRNDATNTLNSLRALLDHPTQGLSQILTAFVAQPTASVDAALRMLQERGMDRAYALLTDGKIAEFFNMDLDDASYSAHMLKQMRAIAQHDLPIPKDDGERDDYILSSTVTTTDADHDYSDTKGEGAESLEDDAMITNDVFSSERLG